jgi:hypothetical protein
VRPPEADKPQEHFIGTNNTPLTAQLAILAPKKPITVPHFIKIQNISVALPDFDPTLCRPDFVQKHQYLAFYFLNIKILAWLQVREFLEFYRRSDYIFDI